MKIEMHSRDGCPRCVLASEWLTERGIPFEEIKHNDFAERQLFYDGLGLTGTNRFVPQIHVSASDDGPEWIAGYDGLQVSDLHDRYLADHGVELVELGHDF